MKSVVGVSVHTRKWNTRVKVQANNLQNRQTNDAAAAAVCRREKRHEARERKTAAISSIRAPARSADEQAAAF